MKKLNSTNKGNKYIESVTIRNETIENCSVDFLDKLKAIPYLTSDMVLTIDQVANYYEASRDAVATIIKRNRDEFELDGMTTLSGQMLKDFKSSLEGSNELSKVNKSLILLTKRSLLRVGMIMTNNAMAMRIRNYLLTLESKTTDEQKQWAIQREVGIIERKRMTTAIQKYLPDNNNKKFAYANYTNMIYKILFGKTAKEMREDLQLPNNDKLRDSLSSEQLKKVEEAETIVTALVALGFEYTQIKTQLSSKYSPCEA